MSTPLQIRTAKKTDAQLIRDFIAELAEFEKLSGEVKVTAEDLERTLFGDRAYAEVRIAEWRGRPAGFALFFHNYSTFLGQPGLYLEDLFVRPEFRSKGIGRELLADLARIARSRSCGRMEWSVLDWNERAIQFYRSLGAQPMSEWTVFRLTRDQIATLGGTNPV